MPTETTDGQLLAELGTDAQKWTDAFAERVDHLRVTPSTMLAWFANAIEAGRSAGIADEARARALDTAGDPLDGEGTDQVRVTRAFGRMPYGAMAHFTYPSFRTGERWTAAQVADNLDDLADVLSKVGPYHTENEAKFYEAQRLLDEIGDLIRPIVGPQLERRDHVGLGVVRPGTYVQASPPDSVDGPPAPSRSFSEPTYVTAHYGEGSTGQLVDLVGRRGALLVELGVYEVPIDAVTYWPEIAGPDPFPGDDDVVDCEIVDEPEPVDPAGVDDRTGARGTGADEVHYADEGVDLDPDEV